MPEFTILNLISEHSMMCSLLITDALPMIKIIHGINDFSKDGLLVEVAPQLGDWIIDLCRPNIVSQAKPALAIQLGLTNHSWPSPFSAGMSMNCQLMPSAAWFKQPGWCHMSTILWPIIPSNHQAWVAFSLLFKIVSWRARQSVLT